MSDPKGFDFRSGVPLQQIPEGAIVAGHVGDDEILVVRRGDQLFAVGSRCTHYHGPLAEGLLVGDTVRCPWHHACFSLTTGEALGAPALSAVACYEVVQAGGLVRIAGKKPPMAPAVRADGPSALVIVGGGAAGHAAAERLRRLGYAGSLTMVGADPAAPYDRPNLSKDYLAGTAPEEWIPLRPVGFYAEQRIDLVTGVAVTDIDVAGRVVRCDD